MSTYYALPIALVATLGLHASEPANKAVILVESRGGTLTRDEKKPGKPITGLVLRGAADADLKIIVSLKDLRCLELSGPITDVGLSELVQLKELRELNIHSVHITEVGLRALTKLDHLEKITMPQFPIAPRELREVARIRHLRELCLFLAPVTDEGLRELRTLQRLEVLDITGADITDAGLKHLADLKNLRELIVDSTKITDEGIKELARQRQWRMLSMAGCNDITEAGFLALANQKELVELDVCNLPLSNASAQVIGEFSKLQWLTAHHMLFTDAGLKHLAKLRELRYLDLGGGARFVTEKGIADLKKALPKCDIHWDPPLPPPAGVPEISKKLTRVGSQA